MRAYLLGTHAGRKVYRFPVRVRANDSRACATLATLVYHVDAYTAADAADLIRDEWSTRAETEIDVFGPRGGTAARRYVGWYSVIAHGLWNPPIDRYQGFLPFNVVTPADRDPDPCA